jgi:hypothetical protein
VVFWGIGVVRGGLKVPVIGVLRHLQTVGFVVGGWPVAGPIRHRRWFMITYSKPLHSRTQRRHNKASTTCCGFDTTTYVLPSGFSP